MLLAKLHLQDNYSMSVAIGKFLPGKTFTSYTYIIFYKVRYTLFKEGRRKRTV